MSLMNVFWLNMLQNESIRWFFPVVPGEYGQILPASGIKGQRSFFHYPNPTFEIQLCPPTTISSLCTRLHFPILNQ